MDRFEIERYSLIAQIIDEAEQIAGIDFYDYDNIKIEKVLDRWDAKVYDVNIVSEHTCINIWFTNADKNISVDITTDTRTGESCRVYYHTDYDNNHHVILVEDE